MNHEDSAKSIMCILIQCIRIRDWDIIYYERALIIRHVSQDNSINNKCVNQTFINERITAQPHEGMQFWWESNRLIFWQTNSNKIDQK